MDPTNRKMRQQLPRQMPSKYHKSSFNEILHHIQFPKRQSESSANEISSLAWTISCISSFIMENTSENSTRADPILSHPQILMSSNSRDYRKGAKGSPSGHIITLRSPEWYASHMKQIITKQIAENNSVCNISFVVLSPNHLLNLTERTVAQWNWTWNVKARPSEIYRTNGFLLTM